MNPDDLSTVDAELVELHPVSSFLELRIQEGQNIRHLPFLGDVVPFVLNGEACEVALGSDLRLSIKEPNGEHFIGLDDVTIIQGASLQVIDRRTLPPFWVVGLSAEIQGRRWPVNGGDNLIGRPGARTNQIPLAHPSVSRTHARISIKSSQAEFQAESKALSALNGEKIRPGQRVTLSPNDLLQIGEWHLRWQREDGALFHSPGKLRLHGLGGARTWVDGREIRWHNEKARDLLYWLAYAGATVPVAKVLEEFWPQRPVLRQRKNLSHCLKGLRMDLGLSSEHLEGLIERTPDTLRLNAELVDDCDFWNLDSSQADLLERGGAFLPENERPWAITARRALILAWLKKSEQATLSQPDKEKLLDLVSQALRQSEFETFVYERACALAKSLESPSHLALWEAELKESL